MALTPKYNFLETTISQRKFLEIFESNISKLTNLKYLCLHGCGLTYLPKGITELTNLELLDLSNNSIEKFPEEIVKIKSLKYLCISPIAFNNIPDEVSTLENLELLAVNNDKLIIKDEKVYFPNLLPNLDSVNIENFLKFKQVKRLDLSNIRDKKQLLKAITLLKEFEDITELQFLSCELESFPEEIFNLQNLEVLNLAFNKISIIPREISKLSKLRELQVYKNEIKEIPPQLLELDNLELGEIKEIYESYNLGFDIRNNPIQNVPLEIVGQGFGSIKTYFKALEKGETSSFYTAKLMIVGQGAVGKTSLMKKLIGSEFDIKQQEEKSTRGIDIHKWLFKDGEGKTFEARIWDFGGQREYLYPHQFFLTKRSLYLLVWDARYEEDDFTFGYWLNLIKVLSDNSPVILVMNKMDERVKKIPKDYLRTLFPNILEFFQVSCAEETNLNELRERVELELTKLPHVKNELPFTWKYLRDELENDSKDKEFITTDDYRRKCVYRGLNEQQADLLIDYLHDLGTLIHFRKNIYLQNTIFLNQEWVLKAIYAILDDKEIAQKNGLFDSDDIQRVWGTLASNYPKDKIGELIELMQRFNLCFKIVDSEKFVLPSKLSPDAPIDLQSWKEAGDLRFEYSYKFMPTGIMTKFISNNYAEFKEDNTFWRYGTILVFEEISVLIVEDRHDKKIAITIKGTGNKIKVLNWVKQEVEKINNTFTRLEVEQKIPCNCSHCLENDIPHLYEYTNLMKGLENNAEEIQCPKGWKMINIIQLLGELDMYETTTSRGVSHTIVQPYSNSIDSILENIEKGKITEGIQKLRELVKNDKDKVIEVTLLMTRWNQTEKDKMGNTVSENNIKLEKNKVTKALLQLIYDLK